MAAPAWYNQADQEIFKNNQFITQEPYRLGPYTPPGTTEETTSTQNFGIPYTNAFTGGGGGGGSGISLNTEGDYYSNLIGDFNKTITDREARINEANRPMRPANEGYSEPGRGVFTPAEQPSFKRSVQDFVYDKVPYINRPQSYKDIMTKGYQEPEGPGLPGIISFMNKMGIQNFSSLPQADQAFIKSQSGYRGPTVFGENTSGLNVDPFGMNVESLFGNYAEGASKDYTKLSGMLSGKLAEKYGVEWDEETGQYTGANAAKANKMTRALRSRYGFRKNQVDKQKDIDIELRGQQFPKGDGAGQSGPDADWGGHGSVEAYDKSQADTYARAVDRHRGPDTPSGVAAGTGASGPPGRNYKKAGGRVPFFYGGIATAL